MKYLLTLHFHFLLLCVVYIWEVLSVTEVVKLINQSRVIPFSVLVIQFLQLCFCLSQDLFCPAPLLWTHPCGQPPPCYNCCSLQVASLFFFFLYLSAWSAKVLHLCLAAYYLHWTGMNGSKVWQQPALGLFILILMSGTKQSYFPQN